jgi:hypothetical protein
MIVLTYSSCRFFFSRVFSCEFIRRVLALEFAWSDLLIDGIELPFTLIFELSDCLYHFSPSLLILFPVTWDWLVVRVVQFTIDIIFLPLVCTYLLFSIFLFSSTSVAFVPLTFFSDQRLLAWLVRGNRV